MTMVIAEPVVEADGLVDAYRTCLSGSYDELCDSHGAVRRHWHSLVAALGAIDNGELGRRAGRLAQRVHETGITYDIFSDPASHVQPWKLNLVPLVLSAGEWRWIERAMIQRARLLAMVLDDIYRDGNYLKKGLIDPDIVFSDDAYIPAARDIIPRSGGLTFYAADIARDHSGRWRVIDSHTETLAGVGFAVANRVTHKHVFGDVFVDANARTLSRHFIDLQKALEKVAGRADARIALLTPGPQHPDYFSHAYMARYLNMWLVEGNDITVRGGNVALKTLEGLKDIDLVVRCTESRQSDPLEFGGDAFWGPAGLAEACRGRPDLVLNPLGSAIVQNRALTTKLGAVARYCLGEDLQLEDSQRLWLGDEAGLAEVAAQRHEYIIRATQEGTGRPGMARSGVELRDLSGPEAATLLDEMRLHGARFVAERRRTFSTMPSYSYGVLVPRPFAMRVFATRIGGDWRLMPGGIVMGVNARSAVSLTTDFGETHDVWVLSDSAAEPNTSLWRPTIERARIERSQRVLQSRVAENLYWLGRNCERVDWGLRVLRSTIRRLENEDGAPGTLASAARCIEALLEQTEAQPGPRGIRPARGDVERLVRNLITIEDGRTLANSVAALYRAAFLVRDRLSQEAWQRLVQLAPDGAWFEGLAAAEPMAILDVIEDGLGATAAFNGLMHENMTRNFGWSFLNIGRRLERAYNLAEVLVALLAKPRSTLDAERGDLQLLLELADSFITYRSRYRLEPMLPLALDLLLLDEANPRSLAYQLLDIERGLEALPQEAAGRSRPEDRRLALGLLNSVRLSNIETIAADDSRTQLGRLLGEQLKLLPLLSDAISQHYFNLTELSPHRLHAQVEP